MFNDILGDKEIIEEKLFSDEMHPSWCAIFCLVQLNDMVDKGIMEMSDGGEKPMVVTEKGLKNLTHYWDEVMKREPNDKDIQIGMDVLRNEGLW
jgi:hypothetical protein